MDAKLHVYTSMDALGALRVVEARARRYANARARRSAAVSVPNPIRRGAAGLGAAMKLTDTIGLGPLPSETGIIRHRLAILCASRVVLSLRAPGPAKSGKTKRDRGAGGHGFSS